MLNMKKHQEIPSPVAISSNVLVTMKAQSQTSDVAIEEQNPENTVKKGLSINSNVRLRKNSLTLQAFEILSIRSICNSGLK
jgi:hypothetical protein